MTLYIKTPFVSVRIQRATYRGTTFVHQLYTAGLRSGQMLSNQRFVNGNRA